jgi:trk system potassium uptake protein
MEHKIIGGIGMDSRNGPGAVIIAGSSRLGLALADQLNRLRNAVTIIDRRQESLAGLSREYDGSTVEGDASDIGTLHRAGINHAWALIAATDDDHENLMIAQIASEIYAVPKVIATVADPGTLEILSDARFTVLCPTQVMTQAVLAELCRKEG